MAKSVLAALSRAESQLLHCIGFVSAVRHDDDRVPVVMAKMADLTKGLAPRPQTQKVIDAAHELIGAYAERNKGHGGAPWARARLSADEICLKFHWLSIGDLDGGANG